MQPGSSVGRARSAGSAPGPVVGGGPPGDCSLALHAPLRPGRRGRGAAAGLGALPNVDSGQAASADPPPVRRRRADARSRSGTIPLGARLRLSALRRCITTRLPTHRKVAAGIFTPRVDVAVAVMGGAEKAQIVGLGAAAERIRHDVIYPQQMAGAAAAPTGPVHIAAAAPITLPDLPPDCRRNDAAAYPGLRRRRRRGLALPAASHLRRRSGGSGGCRGIRRGRVLRRRSCAGNRRNRWVQLGARAGSDRSPGGLPARRPALHHKNGNAPAGLGPAYRLMVPWSY